MIYSVTNPSGGFTYYEGVGSFPATARYMPPRGRPTRGMWTINQALPLVPRGARMVGQGEDARGLPAAQQPGSALGEWSPAKKTGAGAVGAFMLGWLFSYWRR